MKNLKMLGNYNFETYSRIRVNEKLSGEYVHKYKRVLRGTEPTFD